MSWPEFVNRAEKLIKENPEIFSALEEYDRTKRLPKLVFKSRANFTIDADTLRKFRNHCRKNNLSMSGIIENCLKEKLREAKCL